MKIKKKFEKKYLKKKNKEKIFNSGQLGKAKKKR